MAQLAPFIFPQYFDNNGNPLNGGLIYSYVSGTTTPQNTFTDASGVTPNTNPVVLSGSGRTKIFLSNSPYDFVLRDSTGVLLDTVLGVGSTGYGGGGAVDTITILQTLPAGAFGYVEVGGATVLGDGGNGLFIWDSSSTAASDGGVIVIPSSNPSVGRWRRLYAGAANVKWWGAKGDGTTDDTLAITNAKNYVNGLTSGGTLFFPLSVGPYRFTSPLTFASKTSVVMDDRGAFFSSAGLTMNFNAGFSAGNSQVFSGTGNIVWGLGTLPDVKATWFGVRADNTTIDTASLQLAINSSAASGIPLVLPIGTSIVNTALVIPSNTTITGRGNKLSVWRTTLTTGQITLITIGSAVVDVTIRDIGLTGFATSTANSGRGIVADGQNIVIERCRFLNCWRGISATKTCRNIRISDNIFETTAGNAQRILSITSAEKYWVTGNSITGTSNTINFDRGIALENGGSLWGARYGIVRDNFVSGSVSIGIGGQPDTNFRNILVGAFAVNPIENDIGRTVVQGGNSGVLVAYDIDLKILTVDTGTISPPSWSTSSAFTVSGSSCSGTTASGICFTAAYTCSDAVISGNISIGGIDPLVGSGYALDSSPRTVLVGNIGCDHRSRGAFVGDSTNESSVVAANVFSRNGESGIDCSAPYRMVIAMNACQLNKGSGIRTQPDVNTRGDQAVIIGNSLISNGYRVGADALDSGLALKNSHGCIAMGNLANSGVMHGIYVVDSTKNTLVGNNCIDNNVLNQPGEIDGIRLDGVSRYNIISSNTTSRYTGVNQDVGIALLPNCDFNSLTGNLVDGHGSTNLNNNGIQNLLTNNYGEFGDQVGLTSFTTTSIYSLAAKNGILSVQDRTNNRVGIFMLRGATNSVSELVDITGAFSAVQGTASSVNVYYSGGYKIENLTGGTVDLILGLQGG